MVMLAVQTAEGTWRGTSVRDEGGSWSLHMHTYSSKSARTAHVEEDLTAMQRQE